MCSRHFFSDGMIYIFTLLSKSFLLLFSIDYICKGEKKILKSERGLTIRKYPYLGQKERGKTNKKLLFQF